MEPGGSDELTDLSKDISVNDEYSHIVVKYDESLLHFNQLVRAIETARAQILDTIVLEEEPSGKRTILIKLDVEDVREVIFNLLKHELIKLEGYNSKVRTNRKGEDSGRQI